MNRGQPVGNAGDKLEKPVEKIIVKEVAIVYQQSYTDTKLWKNV